MDQFTERRRHSAAHILALAAQRLFPDVKLGIGPVTKDGFYHDFEFPRVLEWEDIKSLESEINSIIQENLTFSRLLVPRDQAFAILMSRGQVYKSELLQEIADEEISFYQTGEEFIDLCRGPHIDSTNKVGVIKLLEITDVNWRNDPTRPNLQRISGVAFGTIAELNQFLERQEAIKNRDFRKFAYAMELWAGDNEEQIYTDKGATVITQLSNMITDQLTANGYKTMIAGSTASIKGLEGFLDQLFNYKNRSYRSLPTKYLTQDRILLDQPYRLFNRQLNYVYQIAAKQYTTEGNIFVETKNALDLCLQILESMDIKPEAHLNAADQELVVFKQLADLLAQRGVGQTQTINGTLTKNSVQLQLIAVDALKREWPIIKLTYSINGTNYINAEGISVTTHNFTTEVVLENIMAYFLEEFEGGLPFWLAPTQALLIPISSSQNTYASHIVSLLSQAGIRAEADVRAESMQSRIREAELGYIPLILVIGEKEQNANAVSVRLRNKQELGLIGEDILIETLQQIIYSK